MNAPETNTVQPEAEPKAGAATMPVWLLIALLVIFFYAGLYFDARGGWFNPRLHAPYHSLAQLEQFQPKADDGGIARGRAVYEQLCAVCHGSDGAGKPGQAPPFAGAEWVITDSVGRLIRIPLQGLVGPIKVKGVEWNLAMPAMGASLSDDDLAALLTYMRKSWGNQAGVITPEMVKQVRADTASRTQPWTAAELEKIP